LIAALLGFRVNVNVLSALRPVLGHPDAASSAATDLDCNAEMGT
jgi:hypothetical protein